MFHKAKRIPIQESLQAIEFTHVEGKDHGQTITVFALSTCGFCRRGLAYLDELGIDYSYVYVDKIDEALRKQVNDFVKSTYKSRLSYPFLCIGEKKYLCGFNRDAWDKEFNHA